MDAFSKLLGGLSLRGSGPRIRKWGVLAALLLCLAPMPSQSAEDVHPDSVKAAFLYNFALFTRWPAEAFPAPGAPLTLCVAEGTLLSEAVAILDGKTVNARQVDIRLIDPDSIPADCHVLYLDGLWPAEKPNWQNLHGVLLIGDDMEFVSAGGHISFIPNGNKFSFAVNLQSARASGLDLSAKLLTVAAHVR